MNITVFGKGNMGKAIGANFEKAGNQVTYAGRDFKDVLGDMVVLAVPYGAVDAIISAHADELKGKIVIDITNPVNFDTFDSLVVVFQSLQRPSLLHLIMVRWQRKFPYVSPSFSN